MRRNVLCVVVGAGAIVAACSSKALDVSQPAPSDSGTPPTDASTDVARSDGDVSDASEGGSCAVPLTGVADAGVVTCSIVDGGGCGMSDVSSFTPDYKPPTLLHQGLCTDVQVAAFVDCLSGIPDAPTCKTFTADAANRVCVACGLTLKTASAYGPLIEDSQEISINTAGCVAALEPCNQECAHALQGQADCESAACKANCPMFDELIACESLAGSCGCKTFSDKATCLDAIVARASAAAVCATVPDFSTGAKFMVSLFCGNVLTDAGGD